MTDRLRRLAQLTFIGIVSAGLGLGAHIVWRYLTTAERFEVRKFSVSGLRNIDESQVLAQVDFRPGANIVSVDLDEIRARVEQLEWVRHAVVRRVLPDEIAIKVIERDPVGLARIRGEIFLFDSEAVILAIRGVTDASFPILDGLTIGDTEGNVAKVKTYLEVLNEIGRDQLSEVHVNDAGEVSVVHNADAMIVNLGTEDYRTRWIRYLQLKSQIREQYPNAVRVDLRFRNQVIVRMRNDDFGGEQAVWDIENRTL